MKRGRFSFRLVGGWLWGFLPGVLLNSLTADAGPVGMTVQQGTATLAASGNQLNVSVSQNALLNWQSFNIAPGETTRFIQPSAQSIVWNRILDANPSQIYGNLQANGVVVLINKSGFYFGPNASVDAAGFVASTAAVTPIETGAGLFWQFSGPPPQARIVNYGRINAGAGGSLFLIGQNIENRGTLSAPGGNIGLLAGNEVLLSTRPDGRALSAAVRLPSGSVDNSGQILADAGTIALHARVVNQDGLIQANSVREHNGQIELVAAESITLGGSSVLSARGDSSGPSDSGKVTILSSGGFKDESTSRVDVQGGLQGGAGGVVEVSAPLMESIKSEIDGRAFHGSRGGRLFIDPLNINLGNSGSGSSGSGQVGATDPPAAGTLNLDVNSAFLGFSTLRLQAINNITLLGGVTWDLAASTGLREPGSLLQLEAGNNINFSSGAGIVAGENWSVSLQAGRDFSAADRVRSGIGRIVFSGNASLESQNGDIRLLAGNNITVGSGFIRTMGGGSINAQALSGSITTGTRPGGFRFLPTGYMVDGDLGGVSTGNGGDVTLAAGQDVISFLPVSGGPQGDGGSGAFGAAAGNVNITAGRDVQGHFVLRNGIGTISAGRDAGTAARLLALSLVDGGWNVEATHDILLQEIRNPNGTFNNLGGSSSAWHHLFDYSAAAFAKLTAGNSVQLRGTALPRNSDTFEQGIPSIYPGRLEISAGSGGVVLGNDVLLFPSPAGNLALTTTDGGSLSGTRADGLTQLIVSDSGKKQYREFGDFGVSDHAATPIHAADTEPVRLSIDGDLNGISLGVPKLAAISVGGNMVNSRFDGQNLSPKDVTSIHVAGDIINRNEFTTVGSASAPDFSVFDTIYPPLTGNAAGLQNLFYYNPTTKELTFQGRMTGDQLQALLSLRVRVYDKSGFPVVDASGEPVTRPAEFVSAEVLNQLYSNSQDVPVNPDTGYRIGGGGVFEIRARSLDLGATIGIVSQGPRANPALAQLFTRGADINLALDGDLNMFSTKIASLNGGNISINAGGVLNVGSRTFNPSAADARGIFTTDRSDISVVARGNINVNGSRIAAYDGGNVLVRSLEGNVDAGTGGNGAAAVEKIYVNPETRQILTYVPTIPGSGILATTFPPSLDPSFPASRNTVGDILIETPRGNISANAGGVVQIPLNGAGSTAGTVILRAGTKDANGNVVYVGNINAGGSGVIGSNVKLEATGDIKGIILARGNLDLNARNDVAVTAVAGGTAQVSGGGSISGTIAGVGSVNVSGATVDAALLSQNVNASGNLGSSQVGFGQGNAATSTSQSVNAEDQGKGVASKPTDDDQQLKRKTRDLPALSRTVGRVTVILPNQN